MIPYYGKYVNQHTYNDTVKWIVLSLCDNSHFFGYIVDIKKRRIIYIDSMYQPKIGKRSIGVNLKEKYFGSTNDDVSFTSCYEIRVQMVALVEHGSSLVSLDIYWESK